MPKNETVKIGLKVFSRVLSFFRDFSYHIRRVDLPKLIQNYVSLNFNYVSANFTDVAASGNRSLVDSCLASIQNLCHPVDLIFYVYNIHALLYTNFTEVLL